MRWWLLRTPITPSRLISHLPKKTKIQVGYRLPYAEQTFLPIPHNVVGACRRDNSVHQNVGSSFFRRPSELRVIEIVTVRIKMPESKGRPREDAWWSTEHPHHCPRVKTIRASVHCLQRVAHGIADQQRPASFPLRFHHKRIWVSARARSSSRPTLTKENAMTSHRNSAHVVSINWITQ